MKLVVDSSVQFPPWQDGSFRWRFNVDQMAFQRRFDGIKMAFQWCFDGILMTFIWRFVGIKMALIRRVDSIQKVYEPGSVLLFERIVDVFPEVEEFHLVDGAVAVLVHQIVQRSYFDFGDLVLWGELVYQFQHSICLFFSESKMLFPSQNEFVRIDCAIAIEIKEEEKSLDFNQGHSVVFWVIVSRVEQKLARVFFQSITNDEERKGNQ